MGWCKRRKPVSCTSSGRYGRCGARLSQPTRHEKGRGGGGAETGQMAAFDAPPGTGPHGIATTPDGQVFFAPLAGNYLGEIDLDTDGVTVLEPPMPRQGSRRI